MYGADVKPLMKDRPENQPAVVQNKGWSSLGFVLHGYIRGVLFQKSASLGFVLHGYIRGVLFQKSALKEGMVF